MKILRSEIPGILAAVCIMSIGMMACHDRPLDSSTECAEILVNPSFESVTGSTQNPRHGGGLVGVEGWKQGPGAPQLNSPDIYDSPREIPRNFMGTRTPLDGNNYAGISQGRHYENYLNESLMGTLQPRAADGETRTYTVSAWFATGTVRPYPYDIEMVLYNSQTGEQLQVVDARVPHTQSWEELSGSVETTEAFDRLIIRGINKAPNGHTLSYAYVDNVSVEECSSQCESNDNELF